MSCLIIKAVISGILMALASDIARKLPDIGLRIASLPLVSVLGMMWLWRDIHDPARYAGHAQATPWFAAPSLPMFVLVPVLLRYGVGFWPTLALGCALTMAPYRLVVFAACRPGIRLQKTPRNRPLHPKPPSL
jgi:hypothetical protein